MIGYIYIGFALGMWVQFIIQECSKMKRKKEKMTSLYFYTLNEKRQYAFLQIRVGESYLNTDGQQYRINQHGKIMNVTEYTTKEIYKWLENHGCEYPKYTMFDLCKTLECENIHVLMWEQK